MKSLTAIEERRSSSADLAHLVLGLMYGGSIATMSSAKSLQSA